MKTNTYIVTTGEYSDYRICGVFSTEEKAQEFIAFLGDENANIEPYELDLFPEHPEGHFMFEVTMEQDGTTLRCTQEYVELETPLPYHQWKNIVPNIKGPMYTHNTISVPALFMRVWAKDEKHAIKIVNEKRVQFIAMETWGKTH